MGLIEDGERINTSFFLVSLLWFSGFSFGFLFYFFFFFFLPFLTVLVLFVLKRFSSTLGCDPARP